MTNISSWTSSMPKKLPCKFPFNGQQKISYSVMSYYPICGTYPCKSVKTIVQSVTIYKIVCVDTNGFLGGCLTVNNDCSYLWLSWLCSIHPPNFEQARLPCWQTWCKAFSCPFPLPSGRPCSLWSCGKPCSNPQDFDPPQFVSANRRHSSQDLCKRRGQSKRILERKS